MTEYDCGTVSLTNAISYLFDRKEIPAELIRTISIYTLDNYDKNGVLGNGGTSQESIALFSKWLTSFSKDKNFKINCQRLVGSEVSLKKITECINNNGVVLARLWQKCEHYVLLTIVNDDYVYLFDPYYLPEKYYDNDKDVEMVFDEPFSHNRIVTIDRFQSESKKDFSLGKIENRECVLINRK